MMKFVGRFNELPLNWNVVVISPLVCKVIITEMCSVLIIIIIIIIINIFILSLCYNVHRFLFSYYFNVRFLSERKGNWT